MKLLDSLFLFKALVKAGCQWKGDISHRKWSEQLFFCEEDREKVMEVVKSFNDVNDYKIEDNFVYIA
jgi:hypothetical protein